MNEQDLMTKIAAIITDMRRIEYDINDPMRHCKGSAKRLAGRSSPMPPSRPKMRF